MGKIILEFDSVEEHAEARDAFDGINWKKAVSDLDYKLKQTTKHDLSILDNNDKVYATEIEIKVAEKYRQLLREILSGYSLSIDTQSF